MTKTFELQLVTVIQIFRVTVTVTVNSFKSFELQLQLTHSFLSSYLPFELQLQLIQWAMLTNLSYLLVTQENI